MRDDPSLAEVPLAVGGEAGRRGVVATCNYQAREFGIHSAMPTAQAQRLCPSLVVVPPNFDKYRLVSQQITEIYRAFTDKIEPLSLDEAFLDVSQSTDFQSSATLIAQEIRHRIRSELNIIVSAGVAPNKFLAKIASDWNKPDGLFVITPEQIDSFVQKLPVRKIFGVGKVTEKKINDLGVTTCGQLRSISLHELMEHFGVMGTRLYELCRGEDERPVKTDRRRKSLSVETTFIADLSDVDACERQLDNLFVKLMERYEKFHRSRLDKLDQAERCFLKMRFDDFSITTIERKFDGGLNLEAYKKLCGEAWHRKALPVRLLGIGVRFSENSTDLSQYTLFD